jgi:hypothetical protein
MSKPSTMQQTSILFHHPETIPTLVNVRLVFCKTKFSILGSTRFYYGSRDSETLVLQMTFRGSPRDLLI